MKAYLLTNDDDDLFYELTGMWSWS